jgi:hypothetical protein
MSFSVPTFNLRCNIYTGPWLTKSIRLTSDCNLAYSRRQQTMAGAFSTSVDSPLLMSLLLPAGRDVRDLSCSTVEDVIECPLGSGRWYQVAAVDDIGKGFPNEHRCAVLFAISENRYGAAYIGSNWPTPIP